MQYPTYYQNQLNGLFDIFKPKKLLAKKVTSIVSKGKVSAPVAQKLMTAIAPITAAPIPTMPVSEIKTVLNQIAMNNLGLPLTPSMLQQYTDRYTNMVNRVGKTSDQAFDEINAEFEAATARMDTAFYESRTGQKLAQETSPETLPSLPGGTVQTAGAAGNSNLLVYGAIAAVAAYLVYNSNNKKTNSTPSASPGLSGVRKRKSSRKPSSRTKTKKTKGSVRKRTAAKKSKKSGRVQTINL